MTIKFWKTALTIWGITLALSARGQLKVQQTPPVENVKDVQSFVCDITDWIFTFAMIFSVIYGLVAAYRYLTAGGDSAKVGEAHHALAYAGVGVAAALIAIGLPSFVASLFPGFGITPGSWCQ